MFICTNTGIYNSVYMYTYEQTHICECITHGYTHMHTQILTYITHMYAPI